MLVGCCCALVLMATAASTVVQVREIAFTALVQCSCAPPSLTPRRIHHKGCLPILRLQRFPLWSPQSAVAHDRNDEESRRTCRLQLVFELARRR